MSILTFSPGRLLPLPGRPKGGEAQAMRALFSVIQSRYA